MAMVFLDAAIGGFSFDSFFDQLGKKLIAALPTFLSRNFLFGNSLARWLLAILLLVLALLFRKLLGRAILTLIERLRKDEQPPEAGLEGKLITALGRFILLFSWYLASERILRFHADFEPLIHRINSSAILILILSTMALLISDWRGTGILQKKKDRSWVNETSLGFFKSVMLSALFLIAVAGILGIFNIDVSALVAGLGLGGLAISLAAKDSLGNLISGLMIMSDKSFGVGDEIMAGEISGKVESIGLRSSRIRAYDQTLTIVPNSLLANTTLSNISRAGMRRVNIQLHLPPQIKNEEIHELKEIIENALALRSAVVQGKSSIYLDEIKADGLVLVLRFFVHPPVYEQYLEEKRSILELVWSELQARDLSSGWKKIRILETTGETAKKENELSLVSAGLLQDNE